MTKEELDFLIQQGEGYNLEFKEAYSPSLAREICALANATGGKILIGVTDEGKIKPVKVNNKIRSEIQDLTRNFDPDFAVNISELCGVAVIDVLEGKKNLIQLAVNFICAKAPIASSCPEMKLKVFSLTRN